MIVQSTPIANKQHSFTGIRHPHQTFSDLKKYADDTKLLTRLQDIICNENYIDEGSINTVYKIPDNDVFLLRVPKRMMVEFQTPKLNPVEDFFQKNNLGQTIANIGGIGVVIKQRGEVLGITNWHEIFAGRKQVAQEDLPEYIKKLELTSLFPRSAFANLITEYAMLKNKGFKLDPNPRNLLLDTQTSEFNIVDVDRMKGFRRLSFKLLGSEDPNHLFSQLFDIHNFMQLWEFADGKQKDRIALAVGLIKSKIAPSLKQSGSLGYKLRLLVSDVKNNFREERYRTYVNMIKLWDSF